MKREIKLSYKREYFEEIFLIHRKSNTSFRPASLTFSSVSIVACITFFAALYLRFESFLWGFLIFILGLILVYFILIWSTKIQNEINRISQIKSWQKEVKDYLDKLDLRSNHVLTITDKGFSISDDRGTHIEAWIGITKADIKPTHIEINGILNSTFPKKSMSKEEFDLFATIIEEKILGLHED